MSTIPLRIKTMMKAYNWSAPKLAQYSGVPLPSLKSILHGQSHNPRQKTLQALAQAFNCPVSDLELSPEDEVVVKRQVRVESIPVLIKEKEEKLLKTAICMVDEIAQKKGMDLSDKDELRAAYVNKLVAFAFEAASGNDEELKIDKVYASWLVGQEII